MASAEDYFAIQNLMHLYSEAVDEGDFDEVGRMFRHANVFMPDEEEPAVKAGTTGFADVLKAWTRLYPETGTPLTRHLTTNLIIFFDSDTEAHTRSSFVVFQKTDELALQPVIVGNYHDRFAKVDGEWRFTERREFITLVGDLSAHLLQQLGGKT